MGTAEGPGDAPRSLRVRFEGDSAEAALDAALAALAQVAPAGTTLTAERSEQDGDCGVLVALEADQHQDAGDALAAALEACAWAATEHGASVRLHAC